MTLADEQNWFSVRHDSQVIHGLSQRKIQGSVPARIMGGQAHVHAVIHIAPLGVPVASGAYEAMIAGPWRLSPGHALLRCNYCDLD